MQIQKISIAYLIQQFTFGELASARAEIFIEKDKIYLKVYESNFYLNDYIYSNSYMGEMTFTIRFEINNNVYTQPIEIDLNKMPKQENFKHIDCSDITNIKIIHDYEKLNINLCSKNKTIVKNKI